MRNGKNYPRSLGRNLWLIAAFTSGLIALLATVWIIVPAPAYTIWLFSVLASEWSLGFGALALIGIICSILAALRKAGKLWIFSFLISIIALFISLYPFLSVYQSARQNNISLWWSEYFSGFRPEKLNAKYTTRTFAEVDGKQLALDIYQSPPEVQKKGVGIVVVHGGSWSGGERNDFPRWNEWLAKQGYTIFDIDYRLAPQPNWQTATGDVKCAVSWVQNNAAEFEIAPEKIVMMGRSAGAHLALLAAYSDNVPELSSSCSNAQPAKVRAVISFYAPIDLFWSFDNPANQRVIDGPGTLSRFLGGNPHESEEVKNRFLISSPTNQVNAQTPPTLLIHGGEDQLVRPQNTEFLAEKLAANNITHRIILIPYGQHGFDYNFNGWGSQLIKPQILEFLQENTK